MYLITMIFLLLTHASRSFNHFSIKSRSIISRRGYRNGIILQSIPRAGGGNGRDEPKDFYNDIFETVKDVDDNYDDGVKEDTTDTPIMPLVPPPSSTFLNTASESTKDFLSRASSGNGSRDYLKAQQDTMDGIEEEIYQMAGKEVRPRLEQRAGAKRQHNSYRNPSTRRHTPPA